MLLNYTPILKKLICLSNNYKKENTSHSTLLIVSLQHTKNFDLTSNRIKAT